MLQNTIFSTFTKNYGQNLAATKRCELFENLADIVWKEIIKAHSVGIDLNEVGITDRILTEIQIYHHSHKSNFGLYSQSGWKEHENGSDIDVFVEVQPNKYLWFALQAKILKLGNNYPTASLRHANKKGIIQWNLLNDLKLTSGCIPYYLFYNGLSDVNIRLKPDQCNRPYKISQFGCSIVKPEVVERIASQTNSSGFISPKFEDFHPDDAQPWRILTCCKQDLGEKTVYSLSDILGAKREYTALIPAKQPVDFRINTSQDNSLISVSIKTGWNAAITLISQLSGKIK